MKAFVVNRVGDFGFLLGIFGVFALFQSVDYNTIFAAAANYLPAEGPADANQVVLNFLGYQLDKRGAITITCLLLFMGAMGKSAQFLLHTASGRHGRPDPGFGSHSRRYHGYRGRVHGRPHVADL